MSIGTIHCQIASNGHDLGAISALFCDPAQVNHRP